VLSITWGDSAISFSDSNSHESSFPKTTLHPISKVGLPSSAAVVNYTKETLLVQAVPMGQETIDHHGFPQALCQGFCTRPQGDEGAWPTVAYGMCSPLLTGGSMESLDKCARTFLEYMRGLQS
jgi:hypothetical protein